MRLRVKRESTSIPCPASSTFVSNLRCQCSSGGSVALSAARDGNWMALQVSDTGSLLDE